MENYMYSRRKFISTVGKSAAALAMLVPALGSTVIGMSRALPTGTGPITIDLTDKKFKVLTETGGAMKIPNTLDNGKPIIVVRTSETTVTVFSSRCTHLGCEISLPKNGEMTCPCHGAGFDADGKVTRGPAKKDLKQYSAMIKGSIITIKANDVNN
jgi:Rieske Fe-S protein